MTTTKSILNFFILIVFFLITTIPPVMMVENKSDQDKAIKNNLIEPINNKLNLLEKIQINQININNIKEIQKIYNSSDNNFNYVATRKNDTKYIIKIINNNISFLNKKNNIKFLETIDNFDKKDSYGLIKWACFNESKIEKFLNKDINVGIEKIIGWEINRFHDYESFCKILIDSNEV